MKQPYHTIHVQYGADNNNNMTTYSAQ